MIKVKRFINLSFSKSSDCLEKYLNNYNITREQIISISYGVDETILLVYEDK